MHLHLQTVFLVLLVVLFIGGLPAWPHARTWGYGPSGAILSLILVLVLLHLLGVIRLTW